MASSDFLNAGWSAPTDSEWRRAHRSGTGIRILYTPPFDRAEIALPAGKFIRISAPGASNGLKHINGLSIGGQPTDQTFLPESIIRTRGDLMFSLSAIPNTVWGTAESSAPPSFGAGSSA